jgi:(5-formylfuran-3-yl)methyl phosphate transaminase
MPHQPMLPELKSFKVMDVLERACALEKEGRDIVHLQIGEPDFDTPECVKDAACKAIRDGRCQYTHSLGIIELREAICAHYHAKYGVEVHPDQVLVTAGTSPSMLMVFSLLLQPGERVLLSDPSYACYPNFIRFTGAVPDFVPVREEDGFQFRVDKVKERMGEDVRGILVNSPSNPTGTLVSPGSLLRPGGARRAAFLRRDLSRPWSTKGRSARPLNSRTTALSSTAFPSSMP